MTVLLLATFVALQAAQAQPAPAAPFQPRPTVKSHAAVRPLFLATPLDARRNLPAPGVRNDDDREIVCGMVVVRKSPDADAKILLPPRETGATIRRIEPQVCTSKAKPPAR
jgi:hypothetical protein